MARLIVSAFADEADKTLEGQIAALSRNHVSRLEIRNLDGRPFVDYTPQEAREAQKKFADAGIRVSALGSPFGKLDIEAPFAEHLEHFKRALELAHVMGTDRMRIFSFFIPQGKDPASYREEVLARLDAMLTAAQAAGVQCAHENEKGIYGDNAERCLDILTVFEGRLQGIFDPANFIQCHVRPLEAYQLLKGRILWMHIKDAQMATGRVVPAGKGDGDLPKILEALADMTDGDLILTLEPHLKVFDGLAGLERAGEETNIDDFTYKSNDDAFDASAAALGEVLTSLSYRETNADGAWVWTK